jgi:hypothetical protein
MSVASGGFLGSGTASFTLEPNPSFSGRSGTLVIMNDQGEPVATQPVTQRGAGCLYSVSPSSQTLEWFGTYDGAGDSPFHVDVHAEPADCRWTATPSVPWIRIFQTTSGTGDGTIYVSLVQWNSQSTARVGDLVIAGLSGVNPDAHLQITQKGQVRGLK